MHSFIYLSGSTLIAKPGTEIDARKPEKKEEAVCASGDS